MSNWFPPPSRPRPVEDGLKARSTRGAIAQTWWSERFIEVLEDIGIGNRLQRGRSYARKGQVILMDVDPGVDRIQPQFASQLAQQRVPIRRETEDHDAKAGIRRSTSVVRNGIPIHSESHCSRGHGTFPPPQETHDSCQSSTTGADCPQQIGLSRFQMPARSPLPDAVPHAVRFRTGRADWRARRRWAGALPFVLMGPVQGAGSVPRLTPAMTAPGGAGRPRLVWNLLWQGSTWEVCG